MENKMKVKELISLLKQYDLNAEAMIKDCGNPINIYQVKPYKNEIGQIDYNTPVIEGDSIGT